MIRNKRDLKSPSRSHATPQIISPTETAGFDNEIPAIIPNKPVKYRILIVETLFTRTENA